VKLCDFGVSTSLHYKKRVPRRVGTAHYMAPELSDVHPNYKNGCAIALDRPGDANSQSHSTLSIFSCSGVADQRVLMDEIGGVLFKSTDVFSFGILLWTIFEQRYPYGEPLLEDVQIMTCVRRMGMRPKCIGWPVELKNLCEAC